jgi:hypothetical protein
MMMNISNMIIPQYRVTRIWSIDHMTDPYYWDKEYHEVVTHNRRGRKKGQISGVKNGSYKGRNMSKRT